MAKHKKDRDPNAAGYASHTPKHIPTLPDHQSTADEAIDLRNDDEVQAGIQTGQTTRGSYATDPSTGAGTYMDHTGVVSSRPVAQPGNDEEEEPDPVDTKI